MDGETTTRGGSERTPFSPRLQVVEGATGASVVARSPFRGTTLEG
jgi:hypothetical protein